MVYYGKVKVGMIYNDTKSLMIMIMIYFLLD